MVMQKYALFIFIFIFRRVTKKVKRLSKVNIGPQGDAKVFNFTMPNQLPHFHNLTASHLQKIASRSIFSTDIRDIEEKNICTVSHKIDNSPGKITLSKNFLK